MKRRESGKGSGLCCTHVQSKYCLSFQCMNRRQEKNNAVREKSCLFICHFGNPVPHRWPNICSSMRPFFIVSSAIDLSPSCMLITTVVYGGGRACACVCVIMCEFIFVCECIIIPSDPIHLPASQRARSSDRVLYVLFWSVVSTHMVKIPVQQHNKAT